MTISVVQVTWTCDRHGAVSSPVAPDVTPAGWVKGVTVTTLQGTVLNEVCPGCAALPLPQLIAAP